MDGDIQNSVLLTEEGYERLSEKVEQLQEKTPPPPEDQGGTKETPPSPEDQDDSKDLPPPPPEED